MYTPLVICASFFIIPSLAIVNEEDDRCIDKASDCWCKTNLCRNADYLKNMFRVCRAHCGWCDIEFAEVETKYGRRGKRMAQHLEDNQLTQSSEVKICQDEVEDCQEKIHKCSSKKYLFQMRKNCRKTCGFC